MDNTLLTRSRLLNDVLHASGERVNFPDLCTVLSQLLLCDVFLLSRKGKLLAYNLVLEQLEVPEEKPFLDATRTHELNNVLNTINNKLNTFAMGLFGSKELMRLTTLIPILSSGEKMGTLVLQREAVGVEFNDDDLILAEFTAAVLSVEIARSLNAETREESTESGMVQIAINSLSYSEMEAAHEILSKMTEKESLVVASRIADEANITRSVIVNALRKLESAGVLESRSLGMKGTYIKIKNERIWHLLKEQI